mgnify:CR=1 FL=1
MLILIMKLKLGINIIIDAGTKYINGHSDVLIGFVSSDNKYSKDIITNKEYLNSLMELLAPYIQDKDKKNVRE